MDRGTLLIIASALVAGLGSDPVTREGKLTLYGYSDEIYQPIGNAGRTLPPQSCLPYLQSWLNWPSLGIVPYLRSDQVSGVSQIIHDVYHSPVVVMQKVGSEELEIYYLEHGLSTLSEKSYTRHVFEKVKSKDGMKAVIIDPYTVHYSPIYKLLKDYKISKFGLVPDLRFGDLVKLFKFRTPIVYIQEKEDIELDYLTKWGDLEVFGDKLVCDECF